MTITIFCRKYKKNLPQLVQPPIPGDIGQMIFEEVSKKAWQEWLNHQTMLINENKLSLLDQKTRKWLLIEMERFFDNADYARPLGFEPQTKN